MASSIFTIAWVKGAGERALKSFVQGAVAGLGVSAATPGDLPGLFDVPWTAALSAGVLMAILSIATSILQPDFTAGAPNNPDVVEMGSLNAVDDLDDDIPDDDGEVELDALLEDQPETGDDADAYVEGGEDTTPQRAR